MAPKVTQEHHPSAFSKPTEKVIKDDFAATNFHDSNDHEMDVTIKQNVPVSSIPQKANMPEVNLNIAPDIGYAQSVHLEHASLGSESSGHASPAPKDVSLLEDTSVAKAKVNVEIIAIKDYLS